MCKLTYKREWDEKEKGGEREYRQFACILFNEGKKLGEGEKHSFFLSLFFFSQKMTNDLQQPVILLSPAPRQEKKTSFLRRKLSSLSLGGHLAAPQEDHGSISSTSTSSSTFSNIPTPSSSTERAQPSIVLQDKYAQHKLGKRIGSGATAKLRLLEGEDGKVVAMKIYKKKDRGESEREYDKRMASEFCISKTLQHQHVVQVYDLLKDKRGRWCTVMEYVS